VPEAGGVSQDRFRCRCGATIATKRRGVLSPVFPAIVLTIRDGKALVACACGKRRWVAVGP
jgi:hypothetical protein